ISESAWEEMTCLFAPSLVLPPLFLHQDSYRRRHQRRGLAYLDQHIAYTKPEFHHHEVSDRT
ncbi:hypothetical protein ACR923_19360, partial [Klebsiella pneumoniae]